MIGVRFLSTPTPSPSLTTAAMLGTGLTALTLALGGIAGLSDDVRAAGERQHQPAPPPSVEQWERFVDVPEPTSPPLPAFDHDGQPITQGS